jgi:hypothetical protein
MLGAATIEPKELRILDVATVVYGCDLERKISLSGSSLCLCEKKVSNSLKTSVCCKGLA